MSAEPARSRTKSSITLEKTIPYSEDAETSVLGAILLDESALDRVLSILRKEDFYQEKHRKIFEAYLSLRSRSRPIDPITLKNELQRVNELENVGGPAYIASLTDGLPRATNIEHYAQIVKETASRRGLIQLGNEMMLHSWEENGSTVADLLQKARKEITRLSDAGPQEKPRNSFEQIGDDRYRLTLAECGVTFEVDRIRRERNELIGELGVRCELPGARTYDGTLSIADFNLSSARARSAGQAAHRKIEGRRIRLVRLPRRVLPARSRCRAQRAAGHRPSRP
jgi:hypothetical protein